MLRDPSVHRDGTINVSAIDCADAEYAVCFWIAERHGISTKGIPAWRRPNGKVRGLSPRTGQRHVIWLCSDLQELNVTEVERNALWLARQKSIAASVGVRSIMADLKELTVVDSIRAELSDDSNVDPFVALFPFRSKKKSS